MKEKIENLILILFFIFLFCSNTSALEPKEVLVVANLNAATIGPVGEPYVQAFPVPRIFFDFLTEGYLTLAESYIISLPYLSWKMVLVGDPLYRLNLTGKPD